MTNPKLNFSNLLIELAFQQCTNFLTFDKATADDKVIHRANIELGDIAVNRLLTNNGEMVWMAVCELDKGHKFTIVIRVFQLQR